MHEIAAPPADAEVGTRLRRLAGGCLVAFATLLAIVFFAVWLGMLGAQREARDSLDWPVVAGRILESETVEHRGQRATDERPTQRFAATYRARVRYEYTVTGVRYEGDRISVFQPLDPTREEADGRRIGYPIGATVEVHHDWSAPARSVLEPGPAEADNTYFFAFGGGFLALIAAIVLVLRGILRAPRAVGP